LHRAPVIDLFGISWLQVDLASILAILVTAVIVFVLAFAGTRRLSVENPGKLQNFLEWIVEFVRNLIASTMDMERGKKFVMLGITLIMFIFVGNMLGLPLYLVTEHHEETKFLGYVLEPTRGLAHGDHVEIGWWKSPTADLSVTMGLALAMIILAHYLGIVKNTKPYFKHYFEPFALFFPLNIIKEISKLLTLGLRLFGNIFAGEVMISVLLMAGVFGILPLIVWQGFSIFVGAIQAFVFTILTMVYISQTTEHNH